MAEQPRRALVSMYDKSHLESLEALTDAGWEIISTGGTLKKLKGLGIPVTQVADVTGFPEIMDGRVKTLHPKIAGALLADRSNVEHMREASEHGIVPIDLVVVNFYPFQKVAKDEKMSVADKLEYIDIGGPTMAREGAKNLIPVVVDPTDLVWVVGELLSGDGTLSAQQRFGLAHKVFQLTSEYDHAVAGLMNLAASTGFAFQKS